MSADDKLEDTTSRKYCSTAIAVLGAKSVGKSSFLRWIANKISSTEIFSDSPQTSVSTSSDSKATNSSTLIASEQVRSVVCEPRFPRVFLLDTDLGQPEFTTSGCLSLHELTPGAASPLLYTDASFGVQIRKRKAQDSGYDEESDTSDLENQSHNDSNGLLEDSIICHGRAFIGCCSPANVPLVLLSEIQRLMRIYQSEAMSRYF